MLFPRIVVTLTLLSLPCVVLAQIAGPVIQRTALDSASGVLTIAGAGLGPDLRVWLDGQLVPVLPGATAAQVDVQAPQGLLAVPGAYRLVVFDPARNVADTFVVTGAGTGGSVAGVEGPARDAATRPQAGEAVGRAAADARGGEPTPATGRLTHAPSLTESGAITAVGVDALASNTTGSGNTAIGEQALYRNTTGSLNTASGSQALVFNTTGHRNTATGLSALYSNTTGYLNTATGLAALSSNTTGANNTATGADALYSNTAGSANTANGLEALYRNTTGSGNTASGVGALYSNTTGFFNTASGVNALYSNTTGYENMASGDWALSDNTTGYRNTASGSALSRNTTGYENTASGVGALHFNTTGFENTASGGYALLNNTTGSLNTAVGGEALRFNTTGNKNTALGYIAGFDATGSFNIYVGAEQRGIAGESNTMRLGLPYNSTSGSGQNRTFIAGIRDTELNEGAVVVYVDANGQLGTRPPVIVTPGETTSAAQTVPPSAAQKLQDRVDALERLVLAQQGTISELRERLVPLEARSSRATPRK